MSKDRVDGPDEGSDTEMVDASNPSADSSNTKSKRKRANKNTTLSNFTIRNPPWSYVHLSLNSPAKPSSGSVPATVNDVKARSYLQYALSQFLGLHGSAIPIDILNLSGADVWVRVPREDASAVVAAVGGWVGKEGEGWIVRDWGCWGPGGGRDGGMDLFGPG